jgi:hypothetical protein
MAFVLTSLQPYSATAVSLTPGWLRSEAMLEAYGVTESNWRDATEHSPHFAISKNRAFVGRAVAAPRKTRRCRWNGQSLSSGQLGENLWLRRSRRQSARAWRHVVEVQDAGKPADVIGYR